MLERIVAAIDSHPDRSARVIEATKELAQGRKTEVLVAHIRDVERPSSMLVATGKAGLPPAVHFESEEQAKELVDGAVAVLRASGIEANGEVGSGVGSTSRELLDIARRFGATVIVIGDRGSHLSDLLLGSVANRVAHLAYCPVLLAR